jgi:hypothetical protein
MDTYGPLASVLQAVQGRLHQELTRKEVNSLWDK